MRSAAVISLSVTLALSSGCDPWFQTKVQVASPAGPVQDAFVSLHCGRQSSIVAAVTDAKGVAELGGIGGPDPKSCWIAVAKEGYELQRKTWGDTCASRVCKTPVQIDLIPASAPPSPASNGAPQL